MSKQDFDDVFPYIISHAWEDRASCLTRPLLDAEQAPHVSYGRKPAAIEGAELAGGVFMMSLRSACESGMVDTMVEAAAVQNLIRRDNRPEWQTDKVPWRGEMRSIYWRSGDDLTASDLLDEAFLREAHALIGAELVIGIPSANSMLACPADMAAGLAGVVLQQYADLQSQGADPLTASLLSIVDGKIAGYAVVAPTSG
jgi:hypothetical protein